MRSPITNRADGIRVRRLAPKDIATRWRSELNIDVGAPFEELPSIEHWRCPMTGFEWYSPPEAAAGGEIYRQLEVFDWYYMMDKWEFGAALASLGPGDRVLEVGAGVGHFLTAARAAGINPEGVEINPTAAAAAASAGFTVHRDDLPTLSRRLGASFDAVCAFQVLEHIAEPGPFIREMIALLRPGGRLILSVPNATVMRRLDPEGCDLLNHPPHHMSHWDSAVFSSLPQYFSLTLKSIHREPLQPYHVDWFVSAMSKRLRRRAHPVLGRLTANRITLRAATRLLKLGGRRLVSGHSLLAVLARKSP